MLFSFTQPVLYPAYLTNRHTLLLLLLLSLVLPAVTPPGHQTNIGAGTTTKCAAGSYRADWRPASFADSCVACGANIFTNEVDQVTVYNIDTLEVDNPETVAASAAACCE